MEHDSLVLAFFLIFAGAAIFSTLALYMRQSLLVAYMFFGIMFGPWGFKTISGLDLVHRVDDIGVIFFMFLLGLQLHQQSLLRTIGKTIGTTLISSVIFCTIGCIIGYCYGYSPCEDLMIGTCATFSSTIISIKLLSSSSPNSQRIREIMISILLLQDLIAIMVLLCINATSLGKLSLSEIILLILSLPSILFLVFFIERFVLNKIFAKFAGIREYMLLVAVAWCLGVAELAKLVGLSYEIGAFIAGLAVATSPTSTYIAEQLKPIRDFFLILFFFVIGASFNLHYFSIILAPAVILTVVLLFIKPVVFSYLLRQININKSLSYEAGIRLGQLSEFSLLVIFLAYRSNLVSPSVIYLVQAVTMMMFIVSSYLVLVRYPIKTKPEIHIANSNS